jgi:microcystin-dependent protein
MSTISSKNNVLQFEQDLNVNGTVTINSNVELNGNILVKSNPLLPVGTIVQYAGTSAPGGWLLCQGQSVSRTEYPELFAVIGSAYGSGGSSSFSLPDLRGRVAMGPNSPNYNLAQTGGSVAQTLTTSHLPAHSHTASSASSGSHKHTYADAYFAENVGGLNIYGTSAGVDNDNDYIYRPNPETDESGLHSHAITVNDSTGGGSSFSILPPFLVVNYLIRY